MASLSKRIPESLADVAAVKRSKRRDEDDPYDIERALEEKHDVLFPRRGRAQTIAEDGDYYYGGGWDW